MVVVTAAVSAPGRQTTDDGVAIRDPRSAIRDPRGPFCMVDRQPLELARRRRCVCGERQADRSGGDPRLMHPRGPADAMLTLLTGVRVGCSPLTWPLHHVLAPAPARKIGGGCSSYWSELVQPRPLRCSGPSECRPVEYPSCAAPTRAPECRSGGASAGPADATGTSYGRRVLTARFLEPRRWPRDAHCVIRGSTSPGWVEPITPDRGDVPFVRCSPR
ncbi:hypothetical protein E143388_06089 [Rhodococcus opacus]|nr:hypothetical protein E143388_06089 [Rhodococcus opacus]